MLLINLLLVCFFHPIHVSVTEIEYNEKNKSLQIISRIYIDDLELSIQKQVRNESLDLIEPKNGMTTDQLLSSYLKEHFKIKLDGKPAKINYLAHEIEDLAIICYLEIEDVKKLKTLEVTNDVIQGQGNGFLNIRNIIFQFMIL